MNMSIDSNKFSPLKKLFFEQAWSFGEVNVRFFVNTPNLRIPNDLCKSEALCTFVYGLNLPTPIFDLAVTELGIQATLSFNQQPQETFVPWTAVVAMGGLEFGIVFPIPTTLIESEPEPKKVTPVRPTLRLV